MIRILFVCYGNICRSTMAEFYMKELVRKAGLSDQIYVGSAATSREQIGCDTYYATKDKLREKGIPFTKREAVQMTRKDYGLYDYIIGFDARNDAAIKRITGGDEDHKIYSLLQFIGSDREVPDPWYTRNFDATYEDVELGCKGLLEKIVKSI